MANKRNPAELKLMAQILDLAYRSRTYAEIAVELRRDPGVIAILYDEAVQQEIDWRTAKSMEFQRQLKIGALRVHARELNEMYLEMEGNCSLKLKTMDCYRATIKQESELLGLYKDVVDVDALPPLLEIIVQQVKLDLPPS